MGFFRFGYGAALALTLATALLVFSALYLFLSRQRDA